MVVLLILAWICLVSYVRTPEPLEVVEIPEGTQHSTASGRSITTGSAALTLSGAQHIL